MAKGKMSSEPVRLMVADDHRILLDLLQATLGNAPGIQIVGKASDGREAVQVARECRPDLILIDVDMPGMTGIEATRQILDDNPEIRVIALSVHQDWTTISAMFQAGAYGYIPKDCGFQELLTAIRAVMNGQVYISPAVGSAVISGGTDLERASPLAKLTEREKEVFRLLAAGLSTKEVAFELNLSIHTAHTHRRNVLRKLNLNNVAQLIRLSIQIGAARIDD